MKTINREQAIQMIDFAASENRVYHYNGGQAYIRMYSQKDILIIIDHTIVEPEVSVCDGNEYFKIYATYNIDCSERLRKRPLSQEQVMAND